MGILRDGSVFKMLYFTKVFFFYFLETTDGIALKQILRMRFLGLNVANIFKSWFYSYEFSDHFLSLPLFPGLKFVLPFSEERFFL